MNTILSLGIFMLLSNIIWGLSLYWIPKWLFRPGDHEKEKLLNIFSDEIEQDVIFSGPKMEEEMNLVPIEDALAVSDSKEKRKLLLGMLKRNMEDNYEAARSALGDEDSETSHYAAAAAMEISRKKKLLVLGLEEKYSRDSKNAEVRRSLMDELFQYVSIGVLSGNERLLYVKKYINLLKDTRKDYPDQLDKKDYIHELELLLEYNRLQEAQNLAELRIVEEPEEALYFILLDIYYRERKKTEFDETLKKLQQSNVVLSSKGLDMFRFWITRGC